MKVKLKVVVEVMCRVMFVPVCSCHCNINGYISHSLFEQQKEIFFHPMLSWLIFIRVHRDKNVLMYLIFVKIDRFSPPVSFWLSRYDLTFDIDGFFLSFCSFLY